MLKTKMMSGLTLIELMCVLVIVSAMSLVAFPMYQQSLARGYRQSAVSALHATALAIESGEYGNDAERRGNGERTDNASGRRVTARGKAVYDVVVRFGEGSLNGNVRPAGNQTFAYKIEAVPTPDGVMSRDKCGVFTLDSDGRHSNRVRASRNQSTIDAESSIDARACWAGG